MLLTGNERFKHDAVRFPPVSNGLNIIENVWALLEYALDEKYPEITTQKELEAAALKEFHAIPQEHIESLIDSIPRRLRAVVAAKGGWTRY